MAKLYFYYSSMNAGKSTTLLQSSFNYRERGIKTLVLTAALDDRFRQGQVTSRIGLSEPATVFHSDTDLLSLIQSLNQDTPLGCVLVDEAQFLSQQQVWQLSDVCDQLGIPVLCYGIRTDFQGALFSGSQWLLAWADVLEELKTICHCGKKATMVVRIDANGQAMRHGSQVEIGGNERYVSLCRKHFKQAQGD